MVGKQWVDLACCGLILAWSSRMNLSRREGGDSNMDRIDRDVELRSGAGVHIRACTKQDLERLASFLSSLSKERRNYLRYDVTDIEILRARLDQLDEKDHFRLIAETRDRIVGDITMDREPYGWTRHAAQIRGVVDPSFSDDDLGAVLFQALVQLGDEVGIELLYTQVMPQQRDLIEILGRAGFEKSATLTHFARDLRGRPQDLHVYTNDLRAVWDRLGQLMEEMDLRFTH